MAQKGSGRKFRTGDVIEVTWADHYCRQGWHVDLQYKPMFVKTAGYFQYRTKQVFVVSASAGITHKDFDNTMFIVSSLITKVRKLK